MSDTKFERNAGILMPVSSLPSPYGIGTFGKDAYDFVTFVKECNKIICILAKCSYTIW